MNGWPRRFVFPALVLLSTCFGVFVVPFLFSRPNLGVVSVANAAGFNNQVATVAAALVSLTVLSFSFKVNWPETRRDDVDYTPLNRRLCFVTLGLLATWLSVFSWFIVRSGLRYSADAGYFIEQMSLYTDCGRKLYDQIEFPYGPLLFYGPIAIQQLLSRLHISLTVAYYTTLLLEQLSGLSFVIYILNRLPIIHKWRNAALLICLIGAFQVNMGLNYTYFRFALSPTILIYAHRRSTRVSVASWFAVGEIVSLALSPEMGLAFYAASITYALYRVYFDNRAWLWALLAPSCALALFLSVIGHGYLLMLTLFAKGTLNLIVEPLPHILLFLFALIWLVPTALARACHRQCLEAPMLASLYGFSLGLLPVAFGRADLGHVFFNGLIIMFLSFVALSSMRQFEQRLWVASVASLSFWSTLINAEWYRDEWHPVVPVVLLGYQPIGYLPATRAFLQTGSLDAAKRQLRFKKFDHPFDLTALVSFIGEEPVATPLEVALPVERALKLSHHFTPSYYCCSLRAVLDVHAEERAIDELNRSDWALLPESLPDPLTETPRNTAAAVGIYLPYKLRFRPYAMGVLWNKNISLHWQAVGRSGEYVIYHRCQEGSMQSSISPGDLADGCQSSSLHCLARFP